MARTRQLNLLFTCAGRKLAIVAAFRAALDRLGVSGELVGADASPESAVLHRCDHAYLVPRVRDSGYVPALLDICREHGVGLVVPLIDTDLAVLAEARGLFQERGALALVSEPAVIRTCRDKRSTAEFFARNGIPTVRTYAAGELSAADLPFPLFLKPADGSGSAHAYKVRDRRELEFFLNYVPNAIVQECAAGDEYTIDALLDFGGRVLNVVPRRRIEVRAGEISKGVTVCDRRMIDPAVHLLECLGGIGPMTIQCFLDASGKVRFTEVNARVGGGLPLTIAAGADYAEQILRLALGEAVEPSIGRFTEDLYMFRYEEAVYVPGPTVRRVPPRGGV